MQIRYFYDVVCPWAWLASNHVEALAAELGATLRWCPVLLGGLFRHHDAPQQPAEAMSPARARLGHRDLLRHAERLGVPLDFPAHHPRRSVEAMRLLVAAPDRARPALSRALQRAYWVEGQDVSDRAVLGPIAAGHGVDPAALDDPAVKQALFDATAEAAELGVFGVPTLEVEGRLYWGVDRFDLLRHHQGLPARVPAPPAADPPPLVFFHDFSSPFSYLGSQQVEAVARAAGARLEPVPILLGALFRDIGTPDVPLLQMHEARRQWMVRDLHQHAERHGIPFRFPSRFPIRTVTPLRVALLEPAATSAIYRAAWAEDRDIADPVVLAAILDEAGFEGQALVERTADPQVKAALRVNTERAKAAGACGVPSFQVGEHLFWGQDRLDQVADALRGWRPQVG